MFLEELFGLKNKTIVVTGGNRGIGQTVAVCLAKAGADVAIFSRSGAAETVAEIEKAGAKSKSYLVDVTKENEVGNAIDQVVRDFGSLNGVFNNAGYTISKPTTETTVAEWREIIDVNLTGEFIVARAAGAMMIKQGIPGSIVNMASMSGHIANNPPWQACYNSSKAGIIHLTRSLAAEWARYGIRVNSISPGYIAPKDIETDPQEVKDMRKIWLTQIPLGRVDQAKELAGMVICLLAELYHRRRHSAGWRVLLPVAPGENVPVNRCSMGL